MPHPRDVIILVMIGCFLITTIVLGLNNFELCLLFGGITLGIPIAMLAVTYGDALDNHSESNK